MQSEMQELIAALELAGGYLMTALPRNQKEWMDGIPEIIERADRAIAAARASGGGWIPVEQGLPETDSRIETVDMREAFPEFNADHMSVNYEDLHRWSRIPPHFTHWRLVLLPSPPPVSRDARGAEMKNYPTHADMCEMFDLPHSSPAPHWMPCAVQKTLIEVSVKGGRVSLFGGAMECGACGFGISILPGPNTSMPPREDGGCPKCGAFNPSPRVEKEGTK